MPLVPLQTGDPLVVLYLCCRMIWVPKPKNQIIIFIVRSDKCYVSNYQYIFYNFSSKSLNLLLKLYKTIKKKSTHCTILCLYYQHISLASETFGFARLSSARHMFNKLIITILFFNSNLRYTCVAPFRFHTISVLNRSNSY